MAIFYSPDKVGAVEKDGTKVSYKGKGGLKFQVL